MQLNFRWSVKLFYEGQKSILDVYSVWPQKARWKRLLHRINFWHVFCFWILTFDLILLLHIAMNISYLSEVVKGFFVLATCIAYTLKVLSTKCNNAALLQLFANLQNSIFCPKREEEKRIFLDARELSRTLRNYYGILSLMSLSLVLLTQYAIDNTELPLATYDPFDGAHGSFGYWIMYFYQCVALSGACFFNISFDSLCCSMFIFVRCQLDILALQLQRVGHNCNGDNREIELQLKKCIDFHMKIVELAADVQALVYKPVSAQILCSVLVLTANFFAMSLLSDEKLVFLKYFIYQSCMLIQVFILCYFAGEVTQRSLKLPHELYKSNWVDWNRNNRRLLLMLMQRLDIAIRTRTINANHAFDLALFGSIVNCSYSYFALLKRVNS